MCACQLTSCRGRPSTIAHYCRINEAQKPVYCRINEAQKPVYCRINEAQKNHLSMSILLLSGGYDKTTCESLKEKARGPRFQTCNFGLECAASLCKWHFPDLSLFTSSAVPLSICMSHEIQQTTFHFFSRSSRYRSRSAPILTHMGAIYHHANADASTPAHPHIKQNNCSVSTKKKGKFTAE